jgi:hypothetical protein
MLVLAICFLFGIILSVLTIKPLNAFLLGEKNDIHTAQMLTYLKLGDYKLGLLLNFHVTLMKNGIKRIINSSNTY